VQQGSQALGLLRRQWRCLINNLADVIFKLRSAKITPSISDRRITSISVAFEGVVPRSGGVHGLQFSTSQWMRKDALRWEGANCWPK
jgi:hypothetical protein